MLYIKFMVKWRQCLGNVKTYPKKRTQVVRQRKSKPAKVFIDCCTLRHFYINNRPTDWARKKQAAHTTLQSSYTLASSSASVMYVQNVEDVLPRSKFIIIFFSEFCIFCIHSKTEHFQFNQMSKNSYQETSNGKKN